MTSKIYWINEAQIGHQRIGTMARPRGNDWLTGEMKGLKSRGVDGLVCLLTLAEMKELKLTEEAALCRQSEMEFYHFPIEDINVPQSKRAFLNLVTQLTHKVREGQRLVMHCRMGIGRSSLLAGAIMIQLGYAGKDVFDIIGQYRGLRVPDKEMQKEWLLGVEGDLKKQ